MTFWKWDKSPGNNGGADGSCPFPEGMAPSQVNDSARGMMAALAKYRDDVSGKLVTSGTATAYTVTSNQVFDSLAHLDGAMIAFVPHADSGASPTLNVDNLGAKPLRGQSGADLLPGALKAGTPCVAFYKNASGEFVLHSYFLTGDIPIGGGCDYWGSSVPSDNFLFPVGQAISRADYPVCFARLGTTYGSGDGATTFNLPDKRGYVSAALDNMGGSTAGRLTSAYFGASPTALGSRGGAQGWTLTAEQLPPHTHSGTTNANATGAQYLRAFEGTSNLEAGGNPVPRWGGYITSTVTNDAHAHAFTTNGGNGLSGSAHPSIQPTIVCNYIIRVK